MEFELHERHAFRNDGKRNEVRAQEFAEIIDRLMINFIDTQGQAVHGTSSGQFALQGAYSLDKVVKSFQKGRVRYPLGPDTRDSLSREPASLVVRVEDLEVAALDLNNQRELLWKLELVTIVL